MTLSEKLRRISLQSRADGEMERLEIQALTAKAAKGGHRSIRYDHIVCEKTSQWLGEQGFQHSYDYNNEQTIISW